MGKLTKNQKLAADKIEAGKAILTQRSFSFGKRNYLYEVRFFC